MNALIANAFEYMLKRCRDIESPDGPSGHHVDRVGDLSYHLARAMGLDQELALHIGFAAKVHDIGKIVISPAILNKQGRLTPDEFDVVKKHTVVGEAIVSAFEDGAVFALAREIALAHHERWNGGGYPRGLKGKDIPVSARIVAVADCLDAIMHKRPYKAAWPADAALKYMVGESGKRFDPDIIWLIDSRPRDFLPLKGIPAREIDVEMWEHTR